MSDEMETKMTRKDMWGAVADAIQELDRNHSSTDCQSGDSSARVTAMVVRAKEAMAALMKEENRSVPVDLFGWSKRIHEGDAPLDPTHASDQEIDAALCRWLEAMCRGHALNQATIHPVVMVRFKTLEAWNRYVAGSDVPALGSGIAPNGEYWAAEPMGWRESELREANMQRACSGKAAVVSKPEAGRVVRHEAEPTGANCSFCGRFFLASELGPGGALPAHTVPDSSGPTPGGMRHG